MEAGRLRLKGEEVWGATRNEMGDLRRAHVRPTQRAAEMAPGSLMPKRCLPRSRAGGAWHTSDPPRQADPDT